MLFDSRGQFERCDTEFGRAMRDGNDNDLRFPLLIVRCQNDGARPIFRAFLAAFAIFAQPEIRIPNDEAGLRRW